MERLRRWADATSWCEWLELAGSLGRGAGDDWSDVDAGCGVAAGQDLDAARDDALAAVREFGPVADTLVQSLATPAEPAEHVVVQYTDGRQLSLVVMPATQRRGLPPGAQVLLDRTGRLANAWQPGSFAATPEQRREWAFLAWWALGDVAKHARRGSLWRAVGSLDEARNHAWRLHAAALGVDYPVFGAVSVENAGLRAPQGLEATLPRDLDPASIRRAAGALAGILTGLSEDLDVSGVRQAALARLDI